MLNTEAATNNDSFYEKFSNDLIEEFFGNVFANVTAKTQNIKEQQKGFTKRLDLCNQKMLNKDNFQENFKKCLYYFEKAVKIKRDLITINEKCINLKKRALKLREDRELSKTKLILEKQKIIENEQKLIPKIDPKLLSNNETQESMSLGADEPLAVTTTKLYKKNRRKPNSVNPGL